MLPDAMRTVSKNYQMGIHKMT